MFEEYEDITINLRLTQEQGLELLTRLVDDDEFRERLEESPAEVLAEYGIEITPPQALPAPTKLASRESIKDLLDEMREGDDPFGRIHEGVWRYKLLGAIMSFPALPLLEPRPR